MADFTLNAPGTTNTAYTPAGLIFPGVDATHGWRSDATGIRGKTGGGKFGHNSAYGSTIVSAITYSDQSNGDLDVVGAIVRTGANAGCIIGVLLSGSGGRVVTEDASGAQTNISLFATFTRANADVFEVTIAIALGTATVTLKQNGSNVVFTGNTTTTYAGEATLAAGGNLSATDYISKFEGTGVTGGSSPVQRALMLMGVG